MAEKRGKYLLHACNDFIGRRVVLAEFPELHIEFVTQSCTSTIDDVSVTLLVNKRYSVTLNNQDVRKNHATVVGEYEFMTQGIEIKNRPLKDETYIIFTVVRRALSSGSDSGVFGTETRTCRVNDIFILEFTETGGDGRTWRLKLPRGISLLDNVYIPHCIETEEDDQRPGCINTHRFVLRGTTAGQYTIRAVYNRAWLDYGTVEKNTDEEKHNRSRHFEVTIL